MANISLIVLLCTTSCRTSVMKVPRLSCYRRTK